MIRQKYLILFFVCVFSFQAFAEVKVISGASIKPESGQKKPTVTQTNTNNTSEQPTQKSTKVVKTKRVKTQKTSNVATVKSGKEFTIVALQNISSKINHVSDKVYFSSQDNIGSVRKGALIVGTVESLKNPGMKVKLNEVLVPGRALPLDGSVQVLSKGGYSLIRVGESFTAKMGSGSGRKLDTNGVAKGKPKFTKDQVYAELQNATLQAKFNKSSKGELAVLIEPPKGKNLRYFKDGSTLMIVKVNQLELPEPIFSSGKIKEGDRNDNSIFDYRYSFRLWDVIKYLGAGSSKLTLQGNLADGQAYQTTVTVKVTP